MYEYDGPHGLDGVMDFAAEVAEEYMINHPLKSQPHLDAWDRISAFFSKDYQPLEDTEAIGNATNELERIVEMLKYRIPGEYSHKSERIGAAKKASHALMPQLIEAKKEYSSLKANRLKDHWKSYWFPVGILGAEMLLLAATAEPASETLSAANVNSTVGLLSVSFFTLAAPLAIGSIVDDHVVDKYCKTPLRNARNNMAKAMCRAFEEYE